MNETEKRVEIMRGRVKESMKRPAVSEFTSDMKLQVETMVLEVLDYIQYGKREDYEEHRTDEDREI